MSHHCTVFIFPDKDSLVLLSPDKQVGLRHCGTPEQTGRSISFLGAALTISWSDANVNMA